MTRLDPFDYAFGDVAEEWFGTIRREAEATGRDDTDRSQFAAMPRVHDAIARLTTPELEHQPSAEGEYLALLFVAYRYWSAKCPRVSPSRAGLEAMLDGDVPDSPIRPPDSAVYVQLPERMLWSQVGKEMPHEPVDGFFAVPDGREQLTVLAVLGLRPDRGGFSQIATTASLDDCLSARELTRSPPFAPLMDGGMQAGFRSIASHAELLVLVQLALHLTRS